MTAKIIKIENDVIFFSNGAILYSHHDSDCCEKHYLCVSDVKIEDVKDLDFDLSNDRFFEKVQGSGIRLLPVNGHPIFIAGYSDNNGYYSDNMTLVLRESNGKRQEFDITECQ